MYFLQKYTNELSFSYLGRSWHDDYLKWICGFANAQGGQVFIGKDDKGKRLYAVLYW